MSKAFAKRRGFASSPPPCFMIFQRRPAYQTPRRLLFCCPFFRCLFFHCLFFRYPFFHYHILRLTNQFLNPAILNPFYKSYTHKITPSQYTINHGPVKSQKSINRSFPEPVYTLFLIVSYILQWFPLSSLCFLLPAQGSP